MPAQPSAGHDGIVRAWIAARLHSVGMLMTAPGADIPATPIAASLE
jgi:hypothetical protein